MKNFSKSYLDLLTGEFKTINLTRIESEEGFYNKQILDSVIPLEKSKFFKDVLNKNKTMVDIGFGGGFPILPLAKVLPEVKFFGFDARAKKAEVVTKIADRLNLKNATLLHQRFEEVDFDIDTAITFKAVGKISDLLNMFSTSAILHVFFYKGPKYKELEDLTSVLKNWELLEEFHYEVEGTEGRTFIVFKNKNVLRGTKLPNKIKFSSLL